MVLNKKGLGGFSFWGDLIFIIILSVFFGCGAWRLVVVCCRGMANFFIFFVIGVMGGTAL